MSGSRLILVILGAKGGLNNYSNDNIMIVSNIDVDSHPWDFLIISGISITRVMARSQRIS